MHTYHLPYVLLFLISTVPTGYPQNIAALALSSRAVLLTWAPPTTEDQNGFIREYTINVSAVETGEEFQAMSTTTSITIITLSPHTTYCFIIAASTNVGMGPFSTALTVLTPEDSKDNAWRLESKSK